jgi:MoaA/NifB/PqqE/SkfB family radical SAM enzyme
MRKIYYDVIRKSISQEGLSWLSKRAIQYMLIYGSFWLGRPLCGPILGTVLTNYNCNYSCKMCDLPRRGEQLKNKGVKELSTAELKILLADFADLGTCGIGFTGGEPLLRDDIFELLKTTRDLGMVAHLNTNGSLLNEEKVNKLLDSGADSLNISLDAATAKVHDRIRGHIGAFDKAVEAISRVDYFRKKRGIPIKIKAVSVLSPDNIDEIYDLIKLAISLKVDYVDFIPEQKFRNNPREHSADFFKKLDNVISYLIKVKDIKIENSIYQLKLFEKSFKGEKSPLTCYAGYNSYGVDCYGLIYPCMPWFNWMKPVGNIRDIGLKDHWYSAEYNTVRKTIARCRDCYLNCQMELNLLFNIVK